MTTQTDEERYQNYERARELRSAVDNWVNREFNFISFEVYEKLNENLFEDIRQEPIETYIDEYVESLSASDVRDLKQTIADENTDIESEGLTPFEVTDTEIKEYILENQEDELRDFISDNGYDSSNYPMWSTVFEFRSKSIPEEWLEKAQEVGLGVIEEQEHFNVTLFASSAGHSFYASYWIPLYLSIFEFEREKYKNIDFNMV